LVDSFRRRGWLTDDSPKLEQILKAFVMQLAQSDAPLLLVSLEDLWAETLPQNIPGTWREYPNWRRKARYTFEEFSNEPFVLELLHALAQIRSQGRH
jgi:4-alpha-glucanotransferase